MKFPALAVYLRTDSSGQGVYLTDISQLYSNFVLNRSDSGV